MEAVPKRGRPKKIRTDEELIEHSNKLKEYKESYYKNHTEQMKLNSKRAYQVRKAKKVPKIKAVKVPKVKAVKVKVVKVD